MDVKMKKSQATLFIIIAVLIIAIISLLIYFLNRQGPVINPVSPENSEGFLQNCLEDEIYETIINLSLHGGKIDSTPSKRFKFGEEDYRNISYLCYASNYYSPCIMQSPVFISELNKKIKENIDVYVTKCVDELKLSLDKKYVVDSKGDILFDVKIIPNNLLINISNEIRLTKADQTKNLNNFSLIFPTQIYDLAIVAQEIASQEAKYCGFSEVGYMIFHPEFNIKRTAIDDSKIYTIKHKKTSEIFRIAIRSCAIPVIGGENL